MKEFFKGWRRKAGTVTLVMACVFAAGWVRSFWTEDDINLHGLQIVSTSGVLCFARPHILSVCGSLGIERHWNSVIPDVRPYNVFLQEVTNWRWRWGEFRYVDLSSDRSLATVPYWAFEIPLILLSAYLLLSKPRHTAPKQATEPAQSPEKALLEYFKDWRRKSGCVTLVIAYVFWAGWCRSHTVDDYISVPINSSRLTFMSSHERIGCDYLSEDLERARPVPAFDWYSVPESEIDWELTLKLERLHQRDPEFHRWEIWGVQIETSFGQRCITVSYWWVLIPLTLLSSWLMLSEPRPAAVSTNDQ